MIPAKGSRITLQEIHPELGLGAVGQWVSQSAAADSAAARELHNSVTIGPRDHNEHRRRPHVFEYADTDTDPGLEQPRDKLLAFLEAL